MYLHNPSIQELQLLDLPLLIEMLSHQTAEYLDLLKQEGYTDRAMSAREAVANIQAVIEFKNNATRRPAWKTDVVSKSAELQPPANNKHK